MPEWLRKLQEMLCRIYQEWGGDCAELPFDVPARIKVLGETYAEEGDPQFETQEELVTFLQVLAGTVNHLDLPENSLQSQDDTALRTLIASLQIDLTPAVPDSPL